jgi:cytochrome c-type biogenesis protein CcmE
MFSGKLTRFIAIGATAVAVAGGAYGIVSATASSSPDTATTATSPAPTSGRAALGGGGSNARSGAAAGGAAGTVDSVSKSSFTLTTAGGQKVTVNKAPSTSAIKEGESIVVLGTVNGSTITATQVLAQPTGGAGSSSPSATKVVPFERGAPSTAKQVGQIPANYTEGSGTIVSGTKANKATKAALAAYPGGIVDRVVKLSSGEYEVHNIGVNWPHHIFVNQNFKVVGAD